MKSDSKDFLTTKFHASPFLLIESGKGVVLKRGLTAIEFNGAKSLETVLTILTLTSGRTSSPNDILKEFLPEDQPIVLSLLRQLVDESFLNEGEANAKASESQDDVFYWQYGREKPEVIERLIALNIAVAGLNPLGMEICRMLREMGVNNIRSIDDPVLRGGKYFGTNTDVSSSITDGSFIPVAKLEEDWQEHSPGLLIAASDFGGQFLLLKYNQMAIDNQVPFMPVLLQEMIGFVGPLVIPGETACLQCLRLKQDSQWEDPEVVRDLEAHMHRGQSIAAIPPAFIPMLAGSAVFELIHFVGGFPGPRPGRLIRIDPMSGGSTTREVLKFPRCPACSGLEKHSPISLFKLKPLDP